MNRSAFMLASLVAITPFAVEAPDSLGTSGTLPGETSVRIAGGAGYYAFIARGCEGQQIDHVPVHSGEAAGEISAGGSRTGSAAPRAASSARVT
jgi:hypothetical protein